MNYIDERNLVWNLLELIILKNNLNIEMEMLNPQSEKNIEFGNFIKGHPMDFKENFDKCIIELERKIPSSYKITSANIFGTGEGCIGITKIE